MPHSKGPTEHPLRGRRSPPTGLPWAPYGRTHPPSAALREARPDRMADHEVPVLRRPDLGRSRSETSHGKAVSEAPMARASQDPLGKGVSEGSIPWGAQLQMAWCCSSHGMGVVCSQWHGGCGRSDGMGPSANSTRLVRYGSAHGMGDSKGPWHRAVSTAKPHPRARENPDRNSKNSRPRTSRPGSYVSGDLRPIRRRSTLDPLQPQTPRCAGVVVLKTPDWSPNSG